MYPGNLWILKSHTPTGPVKSDFVTSVQPAHSSYKFMIFTRQFHDTSLVSSVRTVSYISYLSYVGSK
jgi:hypothetical protein